MVTDQRWVVLVHRQPREPSTARIAVWRRLRALGVARLGDGVVALPADARTVELLEWVAQDVEEAGGSTTLLRDCAMSPRDVHGLAATMRAERASEYAAIVADAREACGLEPTGRRRSLRHLRRRYRATTRRDHFPPDERDHAHGALRELADTLAPAGATPHARGPVGAGGSA